MDKSTLRQLRARFERRGEDPGLSQAASEYSDLRELCSDILDSLGEAVDYIENLESEADDMRERLEAADGEEGEEA